MILKVSGQYPDAETDFQRALDLRSKYFGAEHLCVAQSKNGLGEQHLRTSNYRAARQLLEDALVVRKAKLPPSHPDIAQSVNNLASYYKSIGSYRSAEENYQQALESRRRAHGEDHLDVAESLNDLGGLYRLTGDYVKAEQSYKRALDIRMKKLGKSAPSAHSTNALAGLYLQMGDYGRARSLYEEAYATRKKILPANHPDIAESLGDLGRIAMSLEDYQEAERQYRLALAMRKQTLGDEHAHVADALDALAGAHVARGDYDTAEAEYTQALVIRKKKLSSQHPDVAQSQHQLAVLHQAKGNYKKAEVLYRESLSLREKVLGTEHPDVAESLAKLATLMAATKRAPLAIELMSRAFRNSEQLLRLGGMTWTEQRIDTLVRTLRAQEEITYSLTLEPAAAPEAAALAISMALLRKGRSVDKAAEISRGIYQGLDENARNKWKDLQALRSQIAFRKLKGVEKDSAAEIKKLEAEADRLDQDLAQLAPRLLTKTHQVGLDDVIASVAKALPSRSALVEIVAFRPYHFRAGGQNPRGEPRYLALVLRGDAKVHVADLGPGEPIDGDIQSFIKLIAEPLAAEHATAVAKALDESYAPTLAMGQALYKRVFAPIRPFLEGAKSVQLSLDSQLHLLPFSALHDGKRYLIDSYLLTYLTSGRDLLRAGDLSKRTAIAARDKNAREIVLIAKPEFIKGGSPRSVNATRGIVEIDDEGGSPSAAQKPVEGAFELRSIAPLEGTAQEARDLQLLLPKARIYQGIAATREAFLKIEGPAILHVATHGYFRKSTGQPAAAGSRGLGPVAARSDASIDENPMIDSMLLLANAGVHEVRDGKPVVVMQPEGLVTALDVASMNLWGTQLVVLSACETGVGDVRNLGQGVYGLRRAVIAAGAETLVTSLWKVDDRATRDLMGGYYRNLLAGQGRAEAMRQAARWIRMSRKHPLYWASFIVIGSGRPLEGIGALRRAR